MMTYARRCLLIVLTRTAARELAARCGCAPSSVSAWRSGYGRPGARLRLVLFRVYGIAPAGWEAPSRRSRRVLTR